MGALFTLRFSTVFTDGGALRRDDLSALLTPLHLYDVVLLIQNIRITFVVFRNCATLVPIHKSTHTVMQKCVGDITQPCTHAGTTMLALILP